MLTVQVLRLTHKDHSIVTGQVVPRGVLRECTKWSERGKKPGFRNVALVTAATCGTERPLPTWSAS